MNLHRVDHPQQSPCAVRVEVSRIESLAAVLSRTLRHQPNLLYMFPDQETRRIVLPSFFLSVVDAGLLHGEIHTTENADGAAVWIRPESGRTARQLVGLGLAWQYGARYINLNSSIESVRKRLAPRPHWYLMYLGAD